MKLRAASIIAGAVFAGIASVDLAQIQAPPQPGPATVQPPERPQPSLANPPIGPAILPGTARPVLPTYPQVQIRFGKIPPLTPSASQNARSAEIAARNRIEDAAARCEAQVGEPARQACREQVAKAGRSQPAASAASAL